VDEAGGVAHLKRSVTPLFLNRMCAITAFEQGVLKLAYRLVALDLDGTLLGANAVLSPRNLSALRQLAQQGVHICIITGRIPATAKVVTAAIDFPHLLAGYNGALITEQPTGKELYRAWLQPAQVREVLACFQELGLNDHCDVFSDECWYFTPYEEPYLSQTSRFDIATAPIPEKWPDVAAPKVMTIIARAVNQEILQQVKRKLPGYEAVLSTPTLLEVTAGGVNKGTALRWMADYLDVPIEATIAFGDQHNDVDMIRTAGFGVAMGNAVDAVKQVAKHVTAHHKEDGVAVVLESLFSLAAS
jgi:Cof subfamily protein (haloacid dehalogenase superfamily)